jgi:hypothetical protein
VTAAGEVYCLLLVFAQPVAREVFQHWIGDGINLQIEIAHLPHVTLEISKRYIDSVLILAGGANRELPGCAKKSAILFCDSCSVHMLAIVLQKFARHGVLVIASPPYTCHIFQVFDVLLFGFLKGSKKVQMRDDGLDTHVNHILRIFRAYETVTTSTTITAAWMKLGFEYENRSITTYLSGNER